MTVFNDYMDYVNEINENEKTEKSRKDNIRHNALKTCRDWTNTDCQNAIQIIPMLEKYNKLQTRLHNRKKIPEKDKEGYKNIEKYQRQRLHYKLVYDDDLIKQQLYEKPSLEEMHDYSTFHWAIDENRNYDTEIYDIVLGELDTTIYDDEENKYIDSIHNYRNIIKKYLNKNKTK